MIFAVPKSAGRAGAPAQDFNLEAINPAVGTPTCNLTMPSDLTIGGPWTAGPLGWNGGPTQTCPISGAPAQDAGLCTRIGGGPVDRDQRFAFHSAPCDIGGYEFGAPLLVELVSFTAAQQAGGVQVAWETASEVDNAGFNVYRQAAPGELVCLNAALISAQGGPTLGASYIYDDVDVVPGTTYTYMLEDVSINGQATMHGPASVAVSEMPTAIEVRAFGASRAVAWLPTFVLVFGAASLAWTWRRKRH